MGWVIAAFIVGLVVGHIDGWVSAHRQVARECELVGGFFVGKKVFRCTAEEGGDD